MLKEGRIEVSLLTEEWLQSISYQTAVYSQSCYFQEISPEMQLKLQKVSKESIRHQDNLRNLGNFAGLEECYVHFKGHGLYPFPQAGQIFSREDGLFVIEKTNLDLNAGKVQYTGKLMRGGKVEIYASEKEWLDRSMMKDLIGGPGAPWENHLRNYQGSPLVTLSFIPEKERISRNGGSFCTIKKFDETRWSYPSLFASVLGL